MRKSSFSPVRPYIVSLALVVAATLLTHRFRSRIEEAAIFLPVFAAIVIGAWHGGLGPGLLATIASALLCECFLFEPYRSFSITATPPRLGLFLLVGGLIAALASARRRAAAVEQERRRWHEGMLGVIADAVIASDHEGRVTFLNAAAESLVGWGRLEALGRPLAEVFRHNREIAGQLDISVKTVETHKTHALEKPQGERLGLRPARWSLRRARSGREVEDLAEVDGRGSPSRLDRW